MAEHKTNGLVFGKLCPPHNGHIHLINEALRQTTGDVYLLIYDHPELGGIPTAERAALVNAIIHDPRLKIIQCYNAPAPSSTPEGRAAHMDYMQQVLPKDVTIGKVFCNEFYAQDAADRLGATVVQVDPDRVINRISATEIRQHPDRYREHLHPLVAQRIFNESKVVEIRDMKFTGAIDSSDLEAPLADAKIASQRSDFAKLNADKDPNVHLHMQDWNVAEFDKPHLPVVVGELSDKAAFSAQKGIRILDMAVRMPKQGWAIPEELKQYKESIKKAWDHEQMINPDIDDYYVYVTVDQKLVLPHKSQRRPGYHSDAFETSETTDAHAKVDHTYIAFDKLSTLFQPGPFPLNGHVDPEDCAAVLKYFDQMAEGKPPITYPPHTMVKLTPYDIHTPDMNQTDETIERTFIKISFSKKPYNLIGNRINDTPDKNGKPILDYSGWEWVPRDPHARNHRNRIANWRREDQDRFVTVDPSGIDFGRANGGMDWLKDKVEYIQRFEPSKAEPAIAGEALYTRHGDFDITYNIAQQGDWKITTGSGDQYFISDKKFRERYDITSKDAEDRYKPKGLPQPAMEITKDVCMRSYWGSMQYLPAGSVLTKDAEGKIYGIHTKDVRQSYRRSAPPLDFSHTLDASNFEAPLAADKAAAVKARLRQQNLNHAGNAISEVEHWDIRKFREPHLPVVIGEIQDKERFSHTDVADKVRVLDMAIYMPGQGWSIPAFLKPYEESIRMALEAEKAINPDFAGRFVHITVDPKIVPPDKTGRRPGLHSDAQLVDDDGTQLDVTAENKRFIAKRFGKSDHAYIVHDKLPTAFYPGPFPLDTEKAVTSFDEVASTQTLVTYPNYHMLRLNAYDVHTAVTNQTGTDVPRNFFKLQFTENLLERPINTVNPAFDYERGRQTSNQKARVRS